MYNKIEYYLNSATISHCWKGNGKIKIESKTSFKKLYLQERLITLVLSKNAIKFCLISLMMEDVGILRIGGKFVSQKVL